MSTMTSAKLAVPMNPSWSTDSETDYWSVSHDGQTDSRYHRLPVSDQVSIYQEERNRAGVVTLGELEVTISTVGGGTMVPLTASMARTVAADLLLAAAKVDKILDDAR